MKPSRFNECTPIEYLNQVAVRNDISISRCPRTWKIRTIIAAHRANNNLSLNGSGYGRADWLGLKPERDELGLFTGRLIPGGGMGIKKTIQNYLEKGALPYAVEKMALAYYIETTTGGPLGKIHSVL